MKKSTLTAAALEAIKPPPKGQRLILSDDKVKGLSLRVTSAGRMTWSLRTRTQDGRQVRPTIGTYRATEAGKVILGLADARDKARIALGGIEAGQDPTAAKRAARAARLAEEAALTVSAALTEWQDHRKADAKSPWSERYAGEVARLVKREIPPGLAKRALTDTTRDDWTALVTTKRRKISAKTGKPAPAQAASLYRALSSFLGHAEAMGWIAAPMLARKGAVTIAAPPPARDRVLTDAELLEVWHATATEAPKTRAFARLLILTAAREKEVADITPAELDRDAARWAIPGTRTKNGIGYAIPLSPLALAELAAAWPKEPPAADACLLGRHAERGFQGFGRLKARLDATIAKARAKAAPAGTKPQPMPPWRWHDLRRTARTGMARLGVRQDHAEAAINHVSGRSGLVRTYDWHDYAEEIISALTRWQAHVGGLVTPTPGADVIPLRRVG